MPHGPRAVGARHAGGARAHRRHRDRQRGRRRRRARPRSLGAPHRTDGRPGRAPRRRTPRSPSATSPSRCRSACCGDRRRFRRKPGDDAAQVRREREVVLYGPIRVVTAQATLWAVAAVLFAALNLQYGPRLGTQVGETILLGGIANCALVYLLTERILRETTARALRDTPSARRKLPGILTRSIVFWALGTGVPIVGLMLAGVDQLIYRDISGVQLGLIMVTVGGTALVSGFLVTVGAARAVADPVVAVRQGDAPGRGGRPRRARPRLRRRRAGTAAGRVQPDGPRAARARAAARPLRPPGGPRRRTRGRRRRGSAAGRRAALRGGAVRRPRRVDRARRPVPAHRGGGAAEPDLRRRRRRRRGERRVDQQVRGRRGARGLRRARRPSRPGGRGARGRPGAGAAAAGGGAGGGRRDRGVGGRRGGGQRRRDAPVRVHGDRRPGERGRAAHRVLQAAARDGCARPADRSGWPTRPRRRTGRSARRSSCAAAPAPPGSRCLRPGRSRRARR